MSPRPAGTPPDRLRFQEPDQHVLLEVHWTGPWPPPDRFGLAIGHHTGRISVFDPDDLGGLTLEQVMSVADVRFFRRGPTSQITDDDPEPHLMRGATYEPEEQQ